MQSNDNIVINVPNLHNKQIMLLRCGELECVIPHLVEDCMTDIFDILRICQHEYLSQPNDYSFAMFSESRIIWIVPS